MKAILRNSLLATLVATTGIVLGAGSAFAQAVSENVNFDGLVGNACTFSNSQDGSLTDNGGLLTSSVPGRIDLLCTGAATISVSLPADNGSSTDIAATASNIEARVENLLQGIDASNSTNNGNTPGNLPGPMNTTLDVSMFIESNGFVPAGSYNYNVTVTATPQ